MDFGYSLFIVLGFVAVVLLIEGVYVLWRDTKSPEVQRIERRLRGINAGQLGTGEVALIKSRALSNLPALDRILMGIPRLAVTDRFLEQAGSEMTVARFLTVSAVLAVAVGIFGFVLHLYLIVTLALVAGAAMIPFFYQVRLRQKRLYMIEQQLPESMDLITRSLRAGHAFPSALAMVGTEGNEPIASEFKTTFEEINFGVSVPNALLNLVARVPSMDLRYFVMAVILQRETGGNLAELLDQLAKLMRERFKLLGRIRVLSAEGKLSAWILTLLPFSVAFLIYIINPKYMSILWTDTAGIKVMVVALFMMATGIFMMWRIIKIRV